MGDRDVRAGDLDVQVGVAYYVQTPAGRFVVHTKAKGIISSFQLVALKPRIVRRATSRGVVLGDTHGKSMTNQSDQIFGDRLK